MDRVTAYAGALVAETDPLRIQQNTMVALASTAFGFLGASTAVDGFGLAPTTPASLVANLSPGNIYQMESLEATAWSSLPANTASSILKQGQMLAVDPITFTPPSTTGYSQAFLVEAQYADLDTNPVLLPYYNASNPQVPYSGPGGSGASQNTARLGIVAIQVKAGIAATGTPAIPTPDPGWVGLYVVTLAANATTVTAGNIATYAGAPFIPVKLPGVPLAVQAGSWTYGQDQGALGALVAPLSPTPTALTTGMSIRVRALNAAKGSDTINVAGLGNLPIQRRAGLLPQVNDWATGDVLTLCLLPGNVWQLSGLVPSDILALGGVIRVTDTTNASTAQTLVGTATPAISAYSSSQILIWTAGANNTAANPTLNVTGANSTALGALTIVKKDTSVLAANDLLTGTTYFGAPDATGSRLRVLGALPSDILALAPKFAGRILNIQIFTVSGTYTPTTGMTYCTVEGVGGGAAGAGASGASGASNVSLGAPGTSGCYGRAYFTAAQIGASQPVTIGPGGTAVSGGVGGAGGTTSLGSLLNLPGGVAGGVLQNQVAPTVNSNGTTSSGASGANITSSPGSVQATSIAVTSGVGIGGQGGSNPLGTGGFGSSVNSAVAPGFGYGAGGAGAFVNASGGSVSGGAGRPGQIIIVEYGYTS